MHRDQGLGLLAIGASAGGVAAIRTFLSLLPQSFRTPIVIVQHLPKGPRLDFNLIYGGNSGRRLVEVEDKLSLSDGDVVMAAPDYHLSIERDGTLSLSQDEVVNYSRPSIDVFFNSLALSFGSRAVGFLMSGANHDGALGLQAIRRAGGLTIVQDPMEAQSQAMPRAALALFEPDYILTLARAAQLLSGLTDEGLGAEDENSDRRRS